LNKRETGSVLEHVDQRLLTLVGPEESFSAWPSTGAYREFGYGAPGKRPPLPPSLLKPTGTELLNLASVPR